MKKEKNYTSILGLSVELIAVILMAGFRITGNVIPKPVYYLFLGGFLITVAGSVLYKRKKK